MAVAGSCLMIRVRVSDVTSLRIIRHEVSCHKLRAAHGGHGAANGNARSAVIGCISSESYYCLFISKFPAFVCGCDIYLLTLSQILRRFLRFIVASIMLCLTIWLA